MRISLPWLLVFVDLALALVAIGLAVTRRRGVAGTLAWIFAILAIPIGGALAYLLLANPFIGRTTRRKRLSAAEVRRALAVHVGDGPDDGAAAAALASLSETERSILHLETRLTALLPTSGNQVDLLTEGHVAFARKEEALRGARRSIWAEYYIIQQDETGHRFLDLLAERARAGVDVRLLYDAVGSSRIDAGRVAALVEAGGKVERFLPVNPLKRRWSVHLRNHRKLLVIDGEVGFTGGLNVGDEYSGSGSVAGASSGEKKRKRRSRREGPWRDTHIALRGPAVRDLAQVFAEDWSFATGNGLVPPRRSPSANGAGAILSVVPSGPDQEMNATGFTYFAGIASARSRCYVTSPNFVPVDASVRALESAALRGVDVRVLVPRLCDLALVRAAARSYYPALVRAGVRVYEYERAILHAKTMVVDGSWGVVGSANVDIRSFLFNFEVGAVVFDRAFARQLEDRFFADLAESAEVTAAALARRGLGAKLKEGFARLLSPLL